MNSWDLISWPDKFQLHVHRLIIKGSAISKIFDLKTGLMIKWWHDFGRGRLFMIIIVSEVSDIILVLCTTSVIRETRGGWPIGICLILLATRMPIYDNLAAAATLVACMIILKVHNHHPSVQNSHFLVPTISLYLYARFLWIAWPIV